jgi:hypothetical protein
MNFFRICSGAYILAIGSKDKNCVKKAEEKLPPPCRRQAGTRRIVPVVKTSSYNLYQTEPSSGNRNMAPFT